MPVVILDQAHWTQLEQVQTQVNRKVAYVTDMERFGVPDWWEPAVDRGDCEDIALAKRKRLVEMGWPADLLRIAVVVDGRGELHAVLTVDATAPSGRPATYVLDSHFEHVEPWSRMNAYGYTWLERSKPGSGRWTRLDGGGAVETLRIAGLARAIMPASPKWIEDETRQAPGSVRLTAEQPAVNDAQWIKASFSTGRTALASNADRRLPQLDLAPDEGVSAAADVQPAAERHGARRHSHRSTMVRTHVHRVSFTRHGHRGAAG